MSTKHEQPDDSEDLKHSISKRYETRDLDFNMIGKGIGAFFIFTFACVVAGAGAMWVIVKLSGTTRDATTPDQVMAVNIPEKAPLQTNVSARTDIRDLRLEENKKLNALDGDKIPVNAAMEILANRGFGSAGAPGTGSTGTPNPDIYLRSDRSADTITEEQMAGIRGGQR